MLEARATAELCRLAFPDVLGAARYAVEELEDGDGLVATTATQAAPTPEPAPRRRRRPVAPAVVDVPADTPVTEALAEPARPPLPDEPLADGQVETITPVQRRKLNALLRDVGIVQRADKLALCADLLGHDVATSNDLTVDEASAVIDALEAVKAAEADLVLDDDGAPVGVVPRDNRE
jgi:hypothetical protein